MHPTERLAQYSDHDAQPRKVSRLPETWLLAGGTVCVSARAASSGRLRSASARPG